MSAAKDLWETIKILGLSNERLAVEAIERTISALSNPSLQGWISVAETMPESGRKVLAYYLNQSGKDRRVRAQWIAAKSHESSPDSDIGEYDEEADAYFDPEGWYECIDNWDDYSSVGICGVEVTHWMPLPPPPPEQGSKG